MGKKTIVIVFSALLAVFVFSAYSVWAQTELEDLKAEFKTMQQKMEKMQNRIDQLESGQAEVKETVKQGVMDQTQAGPSNLSWHGYIAANFEDETKRGNNPTFDAFALALIPKFTINDKTEVYSQLVFEHMPFHDISVSSSGARSLDGRDSGEFVVNDAYLKYSLTDYLSVKAGKFATPFGLWNTLQYACPTYITVKQPGRDTFYSRGSSTDTDSNLFGRYSMGVWFSGKYDIFLYDVYVSNGRTRLAQQKDDNRNKGVGGRFGVELPVGESNLKLLYSHYEDQLRSATTLPFFRQITNAVSAEYGIQHFKLYSELSDSRRAGNQIDAFYALAQYELTEKWIPFVQFQNYDENGDKRAHKDQTRYTSWGVTYQVIPWRLMLKAQIDRVEPQKNASSTEDYNRYLVGAAAAF